MNMHNERIIYGNDVLIEATSLEFVICDILLGLGYKYTARYEGGKAYIVCHKDDIRMTEFVYGLVYGMRYFEFIKETNNKKGEGAE